MYMMNDWENKRMLIDLTIIVLLETKTAAGKIYRKLSY